MWSSKFSSFLLKGAKSLSAAKMLQAEQQRPRIVRSRQASRKQVSCYLLAVTWHFVTETSLSLSLSLSLTHTHTHTHTHTQTHTHTHTQGAHTRTHRRAPHARTHTHSHTQTCATHKHVHVHTHIYVHRWSCKPSRGRPKRRLRSMRSTSSSCCSGRHTRRQW